MVPRAGTCAPFEIVALSPAPNEVGVLPEVTPAATFSDFPDPDTVSLTTLTLLTGLFYHTGRYWVDLIDRRAFFQPSGPLTLGQGYTFAVLPGVRSLRGCVLGQPPLTIDGRQPTATYAMFEVVDPGVRLAPEPVVPPVTFAETLPIFEAHCSGGACHLAAGVPASDDASCSDAAAGALSLCARDAFAGLVAAPSIQVDRLVRVAPGDSARSYLLRKLLGAPPLTGHVGSPSSALSRDDLLVFEHWIDAGALP